VNSILASIAQRARLTPCAIAVCSGAASLSYARLQADVERIAQRLREYRVASLGVYLDNGIEWVVVDLAAIAAGVRLVPLPWFFSAEQIRHAVTSSGIDQIVAVGDLPADMAPAGPARELYREARLQPLPPLSRAAAGATQGGKTSFTSGTTGRPRGVVLEQAFIDRSAAAIAAAIPHREATGHLGILPYSTLLENIAGIYVPLMLGKTVYAEPAARLGLSAELGIDPLPLQQVFDRVRPSSLILTPQLLDLFCLLAEASVIDPRCLKFVAVGGARVAESLLRRARAAGIPAYEGYGLTEFGSVATLNTPGNDRIGSVGKPLPGVCVTIAGDGEICLQAKLDQGGNPGPGEASVRVKTGDYGSIDDDGFVYVHGRKSSLIILPNGRNVSPEWLEAELDASAMIAQSYVFADAHGSLSALLMPAEASLVNHELDDEIERINCVLPPYARVRQWFRLTQPFSTHNRMLTANGRLRRRQIAARLPWLVAESRTLEPAQPGVLTNPALQETNPC